MKKQIIIASAAALVLGAFAVQAEEQRAAAPAPTAAATTTAAPTVEATATKPAPTAEATATKAAAVRTDLRFRVTGPSDKAAFETLRTNLAKAPGVFMVNCDHVTGNCNAQVDRKIDIVSWVKTNYPTYNVTLTTK